MSILGLCTSIETTIYYSFLDQDMVMRHFGGGVGHLHSSPSSNNHRNVPTVAMSDPANSSSPEDSDSDNSDMGELQHDVASGDRDNQDKSSDVSSSESDDSSESTSGEDPDSRSDDDGIDFDLDDSYDSF